MSEVKELEAQKAQHVILLDRKERALRLASNPDFRILILEGFCRDDAARYVQESGDPCLNAESRADALALAQASGHLKRYLSIQVQMGSTAQRNMDDLDNAIAEVRAQEGAE